MMSSEPPPYYSNSDVRSVLTWPLVVDAVEVALVANLQKELNKSDTDAAYVNQPQRSMTIIKNEPNKILFAMPGFVGNYELGKESVDSKRRIRYDTLACKLVTSFGSNETRQPKLPNIMANILLYSAETGRLRAIMDGTDITTWRTAGASVVATKYLFFHRFGPKAEKEKLINIAIIGCGVQGEIHAIAMCANFNVESVYLWNRNIEKATKVAHLLNKLPKVPKTYVCSTTADALLYADVVCIATNSPTALICLKDLHNDEKRPLHINAVGAGQVHYGEVAQDIYDQADVYVDSMTSAKNELKGLKANIIGEIGEVITKAKYPEEKALTIFQSMGIAAEDCCVAEAVHEALAAKERMSATTGSIEFS